VKYYFLRLIPPRPDFMVTMTDQERAIMGVDRAAARSSSRRSALKSVHWTDLSGCAGRASRGVAYGPVADPKGGYGAGFWTLPDGEDPAALAAADPAIKAEAGFRYEIAPMPALVLGKAGDR